ncbi:hypothetical protein M409DRAFT_21968 [Zasmidium cellare ATCC 36951]|uniref:Uncharacterized protein n=1 Tax=Zasmidium cellare ATCC 36951 TaxID=1080233 RepID=A0A6A6CLA3_ZASCE|nr:uncharacterized protein M409DRAFT_21968 [Zasmidium cellare ATCC 36951]KAF2167821.1 hypothetical protein M409DRAFT_21968 [Zasmidium cellare ATCC 36951]
MSQSRLRSMPIAQGRHLANQKYTEAVCEINSSKTVAEPLLYAINLLYYVERYSFNVPAMKTHAWGLHSILAADPERWRRSVVCQDVMFGTRPAAIEGCIAAGKPSPFEEDIWFQYEIPNDSSFGAATLSQVAHRILFKIPKLVIYIRKIRSGKYDFFDACETIGLAHRILSIRIDRIHAPMSLRFADLGVLDAFLDYCRARLTIITLCLALQHWLAGYVTPDNDMIVREQADLVQQVLSCWEQCMEARRFPKCMCYTLFPVYGAVQQMKRRGLPVEELISWLELKSLVAFAHLRSFRGESDLTSTWDRFCGGPPRKSIYWQWAE